MKCIYQMIRHNCLESDRQTSNKTTFARIIRKRFENAPLNDIQRLVYYTGIKRLSEKNSDNLIPDESAFFATKNSHVFDQLCV